MPAYMSNLSDYTIKKVFVKGFLIFYINFAFAAPFFMIICFPTKTACAHKKSALAFAKAVIFCYAMLIAVLRPRSFNFTSFRSR